MRRSIAGYSRLAVVVVLRFLLVGVVRRVADDDADGLLVLLLDADPVLLGQPAQVEGALAGYGAAPVAPCCCQSKLSSVSTKQRLGNSR